MKRVWILGSMGSGKSTLANVIAEKRKLKHYDLDDLFFKKKFSQRREEKERDRLLKKITKTKRWVIEGVYTTWMTSIIRRCDYVIFIDAPLFQLWWRMVKRYVKRYGTRDETLTDLFILMKATLRYKLKDYFKEVKREIKKRNIIYRELKNQYDVNKWIKKL